MMPFFSDSDKDGSVSLSVFGFKVLAIISVGIISLFGSFLPLFLHTYSSKLRNQITFTAKYFTAGVLLGVGLIHMLPEATEGFEESGIDLTYLGKKFPLSYAVAALGFIIVWYLEKRGQLSVGGGDNDRLLAVAAQAEKLGGGNICYVQVDPVSSYGPLSCEPNMSQGLGMTQSESISDKDPFLLERANIESEPPSPHRSHHYHVHGSQQPLPHSHDWSMESNSSIVGVKGGSSNDECSALHSHSHAAQHRHVVILGQFGMSYLLAGLFSVHSFVFGAALGAASSMEGTLSLLLALLAHKGAEAFSVGVEFVREDVPVGKTVAVMLLYCLMTPLGIFFGMAATLVQGMAGSVVTNLVQSFGAGTVLYIVMHQLESKDSDALPSTQIQGLLELFLFLFGTGIMLAVSLLV